MQKLTAYLGFGNVCRCISPVNIDTKDSTDINVFMNNMDIYKLDVLLPYFEKILKDYFEVNLKISDIELKYYNVYVGNQTLLGVSIRNPDIEGMVEHYILKVIGYTTIQLIGITSDIVSALPAKTEDVKPVSAYPFILDMDFEGNRVDSTEKSYIPKSMINRDRSSYKGGLKAIITFTCDKTRGADFEETLVSGTLTVSAESIYAGYKAALDNGTMDKFISTLRTVNSDIILFDLVNAYTVIAPIDYFTMWYCQTEGLTYNEGRERATIQLSSVGLTKDVMCVKTTDSDIVTLFYDANSDSYRLGSLNDVDDKTLVIMQPAGYDNIDMYSVEVVSVEDEIEVTTVYASEGATIAYTKNKFKAYAEGEISEAVDKETAVIPKESPVDRIKLAQLQGKVDTVTAAYNGMDDNAKDAYFKSNVLPLIKSSLALAYGVGYIMFPMVFGLISFLIVGTLVKDGLGKGGDKLKAVEAALDGYLVKVKGKTDAKSVAFASNIASLKETITKKISSKKDDEELEKSTKEMIKESATLAHLMKGDLLFSASVELVSGANNTGSRLFGESQDTVLPGLGVDKIFRMNIEKRYTELRNQILNNSGDPALVGTNSRHITEPLYINPIIAFIATNALMIIAFMPAVSSIFMYSFIGVAIVAACNGRTIYDLILKVLDAIDIALFPAKDSAYSKAIADMKGELSYDFVPALSADEISMMDKLRAEYKSNPNKKREDKAKFDRFRTTVTKKLKDSSDLIKESHNGNLIVTRDGMFGYSSDLICNAANLDLLTKFDMYAEASLEELASKTWNAIKGLPRSIYTKYKEYTGRLKALVAKIEQARDDEEREQLLNKEFSPTFERLVSFLTSATVAVVVVKLGLLSPMIAIIGVIVTRFVTVWSVNEKRKRALSIIRNEIEIADEALNDAKNDNNREAKFAIMKTRNKLKDMVDHVSVKF